jgi:hypothetical protein
LCTNPCKNPDFEYYSPTKNLCYANKADGDAKDVGDCSLFCGYDVSLLSKCGYGGAHKLCNNPCKNPEFLYTNANKLCYRTKALADQGNGKEKGGSSSIPKDDCKNYCGYDKKLLT